MNWVKHVLVVILFLISTPEDIRKKELPVYLYGFFILPSVLIFWQEADWKTPLAALLVFAVIAGISVATGQAIGLGDAAIMFFLALYLGPWKAVFIFLTALVLVALFGTLLLLGKKAGKKTEIPLVPFLLLGYLFSFLLN